MSDTTPRKATSRLSGADKAEIMAEVRAEVARQIDARDAQLAKDVRKALQ